jgi:hypothetical protein
MIHKFNSAIISFVAITISTISLCAADRSVNITIPSTQTTLKLTNPSASTVTYSVQCYKQDGTTSTSVSSQTLDSFKSVDIDTVVVNTGKCAGGNIPDNSVVVGCGCTNTIYLCPGSSSYSSASTLCGGGQRLADLSTAFSFCSASASYWLSKPSSFEVSTDYACTYTTAPAGSQPYIDYSGCTNSNYCRANSSSSSISRCLADPNAGTFRGAVCISFTEIAGHCKVTIVNPTTGNMLSSPSFKGGASF